MERPPGVPEQHFLFVTSPLQGHINPALRLAARVAAANPGARVTFSTAVSGHRRMFPSLAGSPNEELVVDGVLHAPYSDGFDEGFDRQAHDPGSFHARARVVGAESLSGVITGLAARGRPVTRVVYTFLIGWVLDVASAHGLPAALYWIQPATVFAVYYHYFHGHGGALAAACANGDPAGDSSVQLPGLAPLSSSSLPSIVSDQRLSGALSLLGELFSALDEHRPKVLINTFEALELDALRAVPQLELVAVGPVVADHEAPPSSSSTGTDLVKQDDAKEYTEWLDAMAPRSVVYVSFGTMLPVSKRQESEVMRGLEAMDRPYLWARGGTKQEDDLDRTDAGTGGGERQGVVVEWCDQMRVLAHPAVGCFVTHCGWNSALESITHGVPMVGVPQWTDQPTVAWLVEREGVGVRAAVDGEGVVERDELRRCVETVMGSGERTVEIRARAGWWKLRAREAVAGSGTSAKSIQAFASGL